MPAASHTDERGGHPPGPPDVDQPGVSLGQIMLSRIVQDQAAHHLDPRPDGASYPGVVPESGTFRDGPGTRCWSS
jgi:hypothetical protein